jgi:hypothetical protein
MGNDREKDWSTCAPLACTSGLRPSASRAPAGRRTLTGTPRIESLVTGNSGSPAWDGANRPAARSSSRLVGTSFSARQRATRLKPDNQDRFRARIESLALDFAQLDCGRFRSATDAKMLPQPEPRAVRQILIVPPIRSREVARAQRSRVGHREDALQPLDFSNGLLGVHPSQYPT